ncbi:ATG21 (YPL100W) [Zygosaccharomyces parabailii]|nr:ATG21 (YPL100W) [Zygosaccharomyces parabailii]CDH16869.1 related to Autophagy-related protein 21 [Zygosaccharomyces bailii ISA1307]SJM85531.1 related to Autophagy-related protein 21 [Zygosaccharomyces bailii]
MKALRFNQDATCCVVSPAPHLVSIYNCDPFGKCFELNNGSRDNNNKADALSQSVTTATELPNDVENNFVIEMLFSTSLVAIADKSQGPTSAKRLKIVNTKRKSTICEISFPHQITDVVMNRKRMCILLDSDQIFIYDISCMKLLETIDLWEDHFKKISTSDSSSIRSRSRRRKSELVNSKPKMALSGDDRSILCFASYSSPKNNPDSFLLHDVVVYDTLNIVPINYLNSVHKGDISCMAISYDGTLVGTASDKGTIIRVFHTGVDADYDATRPLLYEFRRGSRPCHLYQLAFDRHSTVLGCVGNTDTIHIFDLKGHGANPGDGELNEDELLQANDESGDSRSRGTTGEPSRQIANFLTKRIGASIAAQNLRRDFAHINIDYAYGYCLGFPDEFPNQVYIASDDGKFRVYTLPSVTGECVLTKTSDFT